MCDFLLFPRETSLLLDKFQATFDKITSFTWCVMEIPSDILLRLCQKNPSYNEQFLSRKNRDLSDGASSKCCLYAFRFLSQIFVLRSPKPHQNF